MRFYVVIKNGLRIIQCAGLHKKYQSRAIKCVQVAIRKSSRFNHTGDTVIYQPVSVQPFIYFQIAIFKSNYSKGVNQINTIKTFVCLGDKTELDNGRNCYARRRFNVIFFRLINSVLLIRIMMINRLSIGSLFNFLIVNR